MNTAERTWWGPFRVVDGVAPADRVRVIHVDLAPHAQREAEAFRWLDPSEKERLRRFRIDRPRREFALCRAALRANLCHLLGCANERLSFGFGEHGKPFALVAGEATSTGFNLSHSAGHGLIAFAAQERSRKRIGVDAEVRRPDRDFDGIGERVFGVTERAALAAARGEEKARLFYRLWALKEALIKALGTGFSLNPSRFEVPPAMIRETDSGVFRFPHLPADRWRLECLDDDRFAAALAQEVDPGGD